ncbi:LVIVD repeat-containing protein [Bernardetia sp.]|uniref:LVIVD repeat-containing protein n=1 Tax=Bernardetia sp. TaxID=1937974 RepID=UPI0025BA9CF4|nr:hypothetical protein [Bernardetia sp.]
MFSFAISSCVYEDDCSYTYISYEPIFMSYDDFRNTPVELQEPRPLKEVGKIYFYNKYVFVNEVNKGIHIINNSNPAAPVQIGFLNILGNVDMAISGNILYADSYTDLLVIDLAVVTNPKVVQRINNTFDKQVFGNNGYADPNYGVIVDWLEKEVVVSNDCSGGDILYHDGDNFAPNQGAGNPTVGVAGSLARFAISQNHLYTLNGDNLKSYSITNPISPQEKNEVELGWGIETLFPYQNNLFIGSQRGMHIYNLDAPSQPQFVSTYEHITSCDPVVVSETTAYVTLRNGTNCRNGVNELHLIDISDLENPSLINTQPMTNPYGLGVDSKYTNKTLFVCDGDAGLKVLNVTNPLELEQIAEDNSINGYDVIAHNDILMMIGKDGLYQYNYQDPQNLELLSIIPTEK